MMPVEKEDIEGSGMKVISRIKYSNILSFINQCPPRTPLKHLKEMFPEVDEMTLWSINNVNYSKKMRKHTVMLKTEHKFLKNVYNPYKAALAKGKHAALLNVADKVDIAPALVAKRVLEYEYLFSDPHNQIDSPRTPTTTSSSQKPTNSEPVDLNAVQEAAELEIMKHNSREDNSNVLDRVNALEADDFSAVTSLVLLNRFALQHKMRLRWTFLQETLEEVEHYSALLVCCDKRPSPQFKGHGGTKMAARRNAALQAITYLGLLDPENTEYKKVAAADEYFNAVECQAAKEIVAANLGRLSASQAKDGSASPDGHKKLVGKKVISLWMKETHHIPDKELANQVSMCVTCDPQFGPIAQAHHTNIGSEYEYKLIEEAEKHQLRYEDEHVLRARGFDKTPDMKLDVPIAVGGQIVNWIESKALFGDEFTHEKYLKDQLWSYWNRFGPGLVIYWFGYIDEMRDEAAEGIIISDSFPSDFVTL